MRKIIFFIAIVSFVLFACNPLKPKSGSLAPVFKPADSIPRATALLMIEHFKDPSVNKQDIGYTRLTLNDADLFKIFKIPDITRVSYFLSAYLANDSIQSRQNKPTVILQLKQGYHSNYYYYDAVGLLCPPPPGCSTEY